MSSGELVVAPLRARHVYLRPVAPADYAFLQMLETAGDIAPRWRHRGVTPSPEEWVHALWAGVLVQFLVVGVRNNKPIGRVLVYNANFQDRHAYFAALRFEPANRSPLMVYGISLFLRYVFTNWPFEKLYMEVPEYNLAQFASGLDRFFSVEGRLTGHLRTGAQRWDQLILAIHREQAAANAERLRLDLGVRTDLEGSLPPLASSRDQRGVEFDEFRAAIASIAEVPVAQVRAESRVLEDLALDSLTLAELGVVLVDRFNTYSLSQELETRSWDDVTVRALYDEYLSGSPAVRSSRARGRT